ncbi:FxsA family protein [Cohnella endophytica]|uniref:FxsA family protein n=1 Tax=Cohnella endophytica TaxID=2419778 RepID=A0A494XYX6_9BACL|nr:FxsA family protein [Cohnella endophytica]RKP54958.1 FxsA family protein [Cohnella endophytica]
MPRKLLAPIVIFLLLEIWGIAVVGKWIGGMPTFLLIVATAVLGSWLIKTEGRRVWQQAQRQMQAGEVPGHTLLEGLCVLVGGILLIIPGFISDIVGLTMIFPLTRPIYRLVMYRWLERLVRSGRFTIRRGPDRW